MSCEEIIAKILEHPEAQLSSGQRAEMTSHLAGCASCRLLARQWQELDLALSAGIKAPKLSADFDRRLRARLQMTPAGMTEAERAERKRQLQTEFEDGLARLRHGTFALHSLLGRLIWPALAMVAGSVAWFFTVELTARLTPHGVGGFAPNQFAWLVASAVFLIAGLPELWPAQRRLGRN